MVVNVMRYARMRQVVNFPACFESAEEYAIWKYYRDISNERCSICADCTPEFKAAKQAQGRCHPEQHQVTS